MSLRVLIFLMAALPLRAATVLLTLTGRISETNAAPNQWWRPDGRLITNATFEVRGLTDMIAPNKQKKELAFKVVGLPQGADSLVYDFHPAANISDGGEAFRSAWSPNGTTLYYLSRRLAGWAIRAVPLNGGASRALVNFDDPTRQPTRYGFTTDGRMFYFTLGSNDSDVWVMKLARRK